MFGFIRVPVRTNPSGRAFPHRMQNPRTWALLLINRGSVAPHHCMNALDKFSFNLSEIVYSQGVSLSGTCYRQQIFNVGESKTAGAFLSGLALAIQNVNTT